MSDETYEGIRHTTNRGKPTYVMVPRKLLIAWITTTSLLFIMMITSFQYANYVDRRSNHLWCGIVDLFNETYTQAPPTNDAGKILEEQFKVLEKSFECK